MNVIERNWNAIRTVIGQDRYVFILNMISTQIYTCNYTYKPYKQARRFFTSRNVPDNNCYPRAKWLTIFMLDRRRWGRKELLRTTRYYPVLLYTAEKIYEKLRSSPVKVLLCSSKCYIALLRATSKTRYYKDLQGLKQFKVLLHTTQYYVYSSILSTTLQSGTLS